MHKEWTNRCIFGQNFSVSPTRISGLARIVGVAGGCDFKPVVMRTYTLSMPDSDNLLSAYEDPNCGGQNHVSRARETVSASPATAVAGPPLTGARSETATEHLSLLRARLNTFLKADGAMRSSQILPLQQAVRDYASRVKVAGTFPLARIVSTVESLIEKMGKTPEKTGDSAARTLAHSFDF